MSEWKQKRFWEAATVAEADGGHTVLLDGRRVKTPAKSPLVVPTQALARAVAAEWQAQGDVVDPLSMHTTRAANAAIDKVTPQFDEVAHLIAAYGDSDLVCYRAPSPDALIARQAAAWDPLIDWAGRELGAPLNTGAGVMYVAQSQSSLDALTGRVRSFDPFALTALHDLVSLSGSLVIGLAAAEAAWPVDVLWARSRIDEDWQIEQWGEDEEAAAHAAVRAECFARAHQFYLLSRT